MEVVEAIHSWRSIRAYRPDALPRSLVAELLWHAVQVSTPPATATPWEFCVLEGTERIEAWGGRAKDFARTTRPPGASGWTWTERPEFRVFWGAPAVVVICARRDDQQAPLDCCRAGQNLVLAAHAAGLGSCWIGAALPWLRNAEVVAELGLPEAFEASAAILLGWPAAHAEPKSRDRPDVVWIR